MATFWEIAAIYISSLCINQNTGMTVWFLQMVSLNALVPDCCLKVQNIIRILPGISLK